MRRNIVQLLKTPKEAHDLDWLKEALQNAIELEHATLPVYLTGLWSIKSLSGEAYSLILSVAMEEMLHMGLVSNMLVGIGGTAEINTIAPSFPGSLPGGVLPNLIIPLAGLSKSTIHDIYMEIEMPQHGPLARGVEETYTSIGEFYDAISNAFQTIPDILFTAENQIKSNIAGHPLDHIMTVAEAVAAIDEIKEQGEGSTSSPYDADGQLSHYYKFGEIYNGKKLIEDKTPGADPKWVYEGDDVPFPPVYNVPSIPAGGYKEVTKNFDVAYSIMLDQLHEAWNGDSDKLSAAFTTMRGLESEAALIVVKPLPNPDDGNYGPSWLYIAPDDRPDPNPTDCETAPTWYGCIKDLFTAGDVSCMAFMFDLSDYNDVVKNADAIYGAVSAGTMPKGNPWPPEQVGYFKTWMDNDYPEGTPPTDCATAPTWYGCIKDLFTAGDISCMSFMFDLSDYNSVVEHADAIYGAVSAGTMPKGNPWSPDQVGYFKTWMDNGYPEGTAPEA